MPEFGYVVKVIEPPEVKTRLVRREIWNPLRRFARKIRQEFWKITATWNRKPTFTWHASFRAGEAKAWVETDDKIFNMLNTGTKIMWAVMSQDFVPKTAPKFIGSGPGGGRVVIRGGAMIKAGIPARPGIEARKWDEAVKEKMAPEFEKEMQEALQKTMLRATGLGPM